MSTPQGLVVVGNTDWWDVSRRGDGIFVDSRLRRCSMTVASVPTNRTILTKGTRVAGPVPHYFEIELLAFDGSNPRVRAGLKLAPYAGTLNDGLNSLPNSLSYNVGFILKDGVVVQSGLSSFNVVGQRLGVSLYAVGSQSYAQFYMDGVAQGTAETLSGSEYYAAAGSADSLSAWALRVDRDELLYLPTGAQPWGAAARVADRGGYSPGASLLDPARVSSSGMTVDAFRRTVTGVADGSWRAIGAVPAKSAGSARRLVYFEVLNESAGTSTHGGLTRSTDATLDAYVGNTAESWGCSALTGATWHSGASNATGAIVWGTGKRLGVLWDSVDSVWFMVDGVLVGSGDPEANTGARYTNVTGSVQPAISQLGSTAGRARLCTHAREQLYRPAYAEAWDGADLLPEQHFADRLRRAPAVRREVSYYPWANQRNRGAAIGALEINNADGGYDALSDYDLRDQDVIAYVVRADGSTAREFTGLVDGVTQPDARTCRIAIADKTAKLDKRVASPVFALGAPELIPSRSRIGSVIASDVAQSTLTEFTVYDQALAVESWFRSDVDGVAGFQRTVNPAGLQSVRDFSLVSFVAASDLVNGDFSSGSTGWSSGVTGSGATETPIFGVADVVIPALNDGGVNNWSAYVEQAITTVSGRQYLIAFDASLSVSYVALQLSLNGTPVYNAKTSGKHTYLFTASGASTTLRFAALMSPATPGPSESVTLDDVVVDEVQPTTIFADSFEYLVEAEGGLTAADWSYTAHFAPYSPGLIGYWSDDRPTVRVVIDGVCESVLADYYTDAAGVIQIAWLVPPDEIDSADAEWLGEIVESDMYGELSVADDYAPRLSTVAEYQRNYAKHNDGDIAGAVTAAVRQYVTSDRRENTLDVSSVSAGDAGPLHPFYAFANDAPPMPRLCVNDFSRANTPDNASAITDNRLIMLHRCYMQRRRFYRFRVSREKFDELGLRPGGVCEVTHRRYGLSGGKNLLCVAVEPQLMTPTVAVTFWG